MSCPPPQGADGALPLLRASQEGDRAALNELLRRYLPGVRGFVRRHMGPALRARESGSDVLQSVCADLLSARGLAFTDETGLRNWLHAAALNKLRNHERHFHAQKREANREQPLPTDGDVVDAGASAQSPSRELMARERAARVQQALAQLPEHYREVFRLTRIEGRTYAQAAAATGRSEDSVRNILARAVGKLAELLEDMGTAT